jgi:hypothetical protein
MPTAVASVFQLEPLLRPRLTDGGIVLIDGVSGAGKSTLGAQLECAFDGSAYIDLDSFLRPREGRYVDALRFLDLEARLAEAPRPQFLAGVCALDVADRLGLEVSAHVYVMRMNRFGWADEDEALGDAIEEIAKAARLDPQDVALQREVRDYHRRARPHERADFVVHRQEP